MIIIYNVKKLQLLIINYLIIFKKFKFLFFQFFTQQSNLKNISSIIFFKKSNFFVNNNDNYIKLIKDNCLKEGLLLEKPKGKKKKTPISPKYFSGKRNIDTKKSIFKKKIIFLRIKDGFLKKITSNVIFLKKIFLKKKLKKKKLNNFFFKLFTKKITITEVLDRLLFISLLKSHFFFFFNDLKFFLKKGFIYVNGFKVLNPMFLLKIGDVVQLLFSKVYFNFQKKIFFYFQKKIKLLKYKRWRFSNPNVSGSFFNVNPKFLDNFFFYKIDIPSFLEVDFTTLTFSYIRYEFNFFKKNFFFLKLFSSIFYRSYGWKRLI